MKKETLDKLTNLQDALNEFITKDWKQNRTELDFMVANHQEMAELIDTAVDASTTDKKTSLGWKWWKNAAGERTMDSVEWDALDEKVLDNIKIELTDLLFFTLSQKVLGDLSGEDDIVSLHDNDWVNFMSISAMNLLQRPGMALMLILELSNKIGFNISAYYVAKHTLNHIRQLNGYKDNSYKKVNDGIEDNELLHAIISDITVNDIDANFEVIADGIISGVYDAFDVSTDDRMNLEKWNKTIQ